MLNTQQQQAFEYLFGVLDKNTNGYITKDDFAKAFDGIKAQSDAAKIAKIDKVIMLHFLSLKSTGVDTDKDAQISKAEWLDWAAGFVKNVQDVQAAQAAAPDEPTPSLSTKYSHFVNAIFVGITTDDVNSTLAEYEAWFQAFGLKGDAAAIFKTLDTNGNGIIIKDEFIEHFKAFVLADDSKAGYHLFGNI